MAYSGLDTLFQNLGPTGASLIAGQREGYAQGLDQIQAATQQQALLAAQEKAKQDALMSPLNLQLKQGEIARQAAELPGLQGISQQNVSKGNVAKATEDQDILSAIESGKTKITEQQLKRQENMAQMAGNLGQILKGQPPIYHADTRRRYLESNGIDPQSPGGRVVMESPPEDLINTANQITDMNERIRQAVKVANISAETQITTTGMNNRTQKELEDKRIAAGKYEKAAGGKDFVTKLLTSPPKTRLGSVEAILKSGISPETKNDLTEIEKQYYQAMYDQDSRTVNADLATRTGEGIIVTAKPGGGTGIANKTAPTVGEPAAKPALPPGWVMK